MKTKELDVHKLFVQVECSLRDFSCHDFDIVGCKMVCNTELNVWCEK